MWSVIAKITEKYCAHAAAWGEETYLKRCSLWLAQNVFGLCRWLWVSNRSGNTKQGSNVISVCRHNWETLCSHRVRRGDLSQKLLSLICAVECFRPITYNCQLKKHFMALIRDSNFQGAPLAMMPNYLRNFRLSHRLLTPFELYLVILYLLQTSKHWIESILQCTSGLPNLIIWQNKVCTYQDGRVWETILRECLHIED
jgi:hypothetical protein